jgi:DEAD/DEAH box helicase domain-containing protein
VSKLNRFDILEEIYKGLGFRIKLDNLAQATLGVGKSGSGLQAIELYKNGQIDELRSYCLDDVKITKELYEYGKLHGSLKYQDLQGTKEVLVNFNPEIKRPESLNLSLF